MTDDYVEIASFDVPTIRASAAGGDGVALVTGDGVAYVEGSHRRDIAVDAPIDVAVGSLAYVLTDDGVIALSTASNDRVWSADVDGEGVALAALPSANVVCALTASKLVALDGETGAVRWRRERPYADVGSDATFLGRHGRFLLATWSFVAGVDADGELTLEATLESRITAVDATPNAVVAALKNDQLVGIDPGTGAVDWRTEMGVAGIAPGPDGRVVVRTEDGFLAVDGSGANHQVDADVGGNVLSTRDGTDLCVRRGSTLSVYRRALSPEAVTATVESEAVASDGTVAVRIGSRGSDGVARIGASATGATLEDATRVVPVRADGTETIEFAAVDITDARFAVTVTADERILTRATVSADAVSDTPSIAATLSLERVDGDAVAAELAVTNEGDDSTSLSVAEDGIDVGQIEPGAVDTVRVTDRFVPGGRIERTLQNSDGEPVATASVELPDGRPALSVATRIDGDFGFVDVTLENPTESALEDELTVSGLGDCPPVSRPVSCPAGSTWTMAVTLPPRTAASVAGETVVARISGRDLAENAENAFADAEISVGRSASGAGTIEGSERDAPDPVPARSSAPSADESEASVESLEPACPTATVRRSLSSETPFATETFLEYLSVEVDRDPDDAVLVMAETTRPLPELAADRPVRLRRAHAVFDESGTNLPGAVVRNGGDAIGGVDARTIDVEPGPLTVRALLDREGTGRAVVSVENRLAEPIEIGRVRLEGVETWENNGMMIAAGELAQFEASLTGADCSLLDDRDAVPADVEFARGGEWRRFRSLAFLDDASTDATARVADSLEVALGEGTTVADEYSHLVLEVTNASGDPVRELALTADGDAVNETLYVEESVASLEPAETLEHYVDVKPDDAGDRMSLEVTVDCADHESDVLTLAGPVAPDETAWSNEVRSAWSLSWADGGDDADGPDPSIPDHLATPFERTE